MLKINEWEMVYMKKIQMDKSRIEKRLVKGGGGAFGNEWNPSCAQREQ